jgi:hypothetical protein
MNDDCLERQQWLLNRFSGLGITADIGAMGLIDLWGLYRLLRRLAGEA